MSPPAGPRPRRALGVASVRLAGVMPEKSPIEMGALSPPRRGVWPAWRRAKLAASSIRRSFPRAGVRSGVRTGSCAGVAVWSASRPRVASPPAPSSSSATASWGPWARAIARSSSSPTCGAGRESFPRWITGPAWFISSIRFKCSGPSFRALIFSAALSCLICSASTSRLRFPSMSCRLIGRNRCWACFCFHSRSSSVTS
mmetsp:Transcript_19399/g.54485  ORF Transcript_19399/g.54485 Transcript_19399/m.54485 type:complete len:200 (-) Transcript_19399:319-918(-)